mmetsp:Transcript_12816/g.32461  ORF Transcript_12816/g.32461 Transcript_12816/m.32461 type:complete len:202 (-) Transcript_12816:89-694(-)
MHCLHRRNRRALPRAQRSRAPHLPRHEGGVHAAVGRADPRRLRNRRRRHRRHQPPQGHRPRLSPPHAAPLQRRPPGHRRPPARPPIHPPRRQPRPGLQRPRDRLAHRRLQRRRTQGALPRRRDAGAEGVDGGGRCRRRRRFVGGWLCAATDDAARRAGAGGRGGGAVPVSFCFLFSNAHPSPAPRKCSERADRRRGGGFRA